MTWLAFHSLLGACLRCFWSVISTLTKARVAWCHISLASSEETLQWQQESKHPAESVCREYPSTQRRCLGRECFRGEAGKSRGHQLHGGHVDLQQKSWTPKRHSSCSRKDTYAQQPENVFS